MIFEPPVPGMRFLAHEVVQTSAMDCGPASLKSILEGFGIPVSYGRLREACQTDVDGTSIDTIEDLAVQLGLQAEQIMIPSDHIIIEEAQVLPAIAVIRLPNGLTHFLVLWGRFGNRLQLMDPASGRRWTSWDRFRHELYTHTMPVDAQAWRDWAGSPGMIEPLKRRMLNLELGGEQIETLIEDALIDPGWYSLAALDAAVRMVTALVDARGIEKGTIAGNLLVEFIARSRQNPPVGDSGDVVRDAQRVDSPGDAPQALTIPEVYWSVTPLPIQAGDPGAPMLLLRGAVLVRITGVQEAPQPGEAGTGATAVEFETSAVETLTTPQPLSPDLVAALSEPATRPEREIYHALKEDGLLTPVILVMALFIAALAVLVEALLLQGMLRVGESLGAGSQRFWAFVVMIAFVTLPLLLEIPLTSTVLRMGRRLETRLRIAFLEKIPRLGDRYFRSRLTSDMTQRAYELRQLRSLPDLGVQLLRLFFQLILTTLGIIWLDPPSALVAILGTALFIVFSFLSTPVMQESEMRFRTNTGALSRFYLDALLGLVPIKSHGAERSLRRQHEMQLFEWMRTGRQMYNLSSFIQGAGVLIYTVFSVLIVFSYLVRGGNPASMLLLFYWTLSLPTIGASLAGAVQQYPMLRSRYLRLLEPLGAPDEEEAWVAGGEAAPVGETADPLESENQVGPVRVSIQDVDLVAGGNPILEDISVDFRAGEHVAIIGPSGAGKSSLVGLLLGWHRPARGRILVDDLPLDGMSMRKLRRSTAWVDPAVQLWNWSFYENLRFGSQEEASAPMGQVIRDADLFSVLERLPDGLKTPLGEGGGLVSGGEGQRVRLGRALMKQQVRLVVLDEPFRGLDRQTRRDMLRRARDHWGQATLLCVTHDVAETRSFERVLVIEQGRIVEDGSPQSLEQDPDSHYSAMLAADERVYQDFWSDPGWRKWVIADGKLEEHQPAEQSLNKGTSSAGPLQQR